MRRPSLLPSSLLLLGAVGLSCSAFDPGFGALRGSEEGEYGGAAATATEGSGGAGGDIQFGRDIRPLMERPPTNPTGRGCRMCHYSTQPTHVGIDLGGLDLTTLGSLREGGTTSGSKIVIPGDPAGSVLVQKLKGTYSFGARMPRDGPYWTDGDISKVELWIEQGAKGAASE